MRKGLMGSRSWCAIAHGPEPSGDGRSIAYITREASDRAIYFMRSGTPSRRVVNYPGDDGRELSQLAVSRAGGATAYVRDTSPNSAGEILNPGSDPDTPHRLIYIVASRAGAPRMLGDGLAPAFTPDDSMLVWVNGTSVMSVTLSWDDEGHLTDAGSPAPLFTWPAARRRTCASRRTAPSCSTRAPTASRCSTWPRTRRQRSRTRARATRTRCGRPTGRRSRSGAAFPGSRGRSGSPTRRR